MASVTEVISYLAPGAKCHGYGPNYEDIVWVDGEAPFTKKEFLAAFDKVDEMKAKAKADAEAKLQALGLTRDDLNLLLS